MKKKQHHMDPDQDGQNVCPDLDPNCLTLWQCSKNLLKMFILKKSKQTALIIEHYPTYKELLSYINVNNCVARKMSTKFE